MAKRKPFQPVLIGTHSPNCYAIKEVRAGRWDTPWAYLETVDYRDSIGRKQHGSHLRWWTAKCNCTHCPAQILVCERLLLCAQPSGDVESAKETSGEP